MKVTGITPRGYCKGVVRAINIAKEARKAGFDMHLFFRNSREGNKRKEDDQELIGSWLDKVISERLCYITGYNGSFNTFNTRALIRRLDEIKPDLIHLHSLCDRSDPVFSDFSRYQGQQADGDHRDLRYDGLCCRRSRLLYLRFAENEKMEFSEG